MNWRKSHLAIICSFLAISAACSTRVDNQKTVEFNFTGLFTEDQLGLDLSEAGEEIWFLKVELINNRDSPILINGGDSIYQELFLLHSLTEYFYYDNYEKERFHNFGFGGGGPHAISIDANTKKSFLSIVDFPIESDSITLGYKYRVSMDSMCGAEIRYTLIDSKIIKKIGHKVGCWYAPDETYQ